LIACPIADLRLRARPGNTFADVVGLGSESGQGCFVFTARKYQEKINFLAGDRVPQKGLLYKSKTPRQEEAGNIYLLNSGMRDFPETRRAGSPTPYEEGT